MTTKRRIPRGGKPLVKPRDVEFDIKAIRKIQGRKKGVCKYQRKQSKQKGR